MTTPTVDKAAIRTSLHNRGICVIIPVYNNVGTVDAVVSDALQYCGDVFVVDDGSTDGTTAVLRQRSDIRLVHYDCNRGKGHALKEGFRAALAEGFAYAITMDADGQHSASDIPAFLTANRRWPDALIVGARSERGASDAKGSRFANRFSNFWFCVQTFHHLPDTQTGYRLYPLRRLHGYRLITARYEAELELLVFASWHGVALRSIPVSVYYPPRGERVSHFRPGLDFTRISILNTLLCLLAVVCALPLWLLRTTATLLRTIGTAAMLLIPLFFIFTPSIWLYVKIGKMTEQKKRAIHQLMYRVIRFAVYRIGLPGVRFRCQVNPEVDFNKPSVIVCNHQSHLDLLYLLTLSPRLIFLTNGWAYHNPFYGFIIRHAEYYPATMGIDELLPHFKSLVARGYSIAIFPEGTRSVDLQIGPFHRGAAYVADELGLAITPILLHGTGHVLRKHCHHLNKGLVRLIVDKPISVETLQQHPTLKQQTRLLHDCYVEWLAQVDDEMARNNRRNGQ